MEGGAISGNSANGKTGSGGGGVQIGEESVFTMTGGAISDNTSAGGSNAHDGGVRVAKSATFTLSGGAISGPMVTTLAGSGGGFGFGNGGFADGPGAEAQFNRPHGIAVDNAGNVYVGDMANQRIRKITISAP
jgi:hypothetical protein